MSDGLSKTLCDVGIDDMDPQTWRTMSVEQRHAWLHHWGQRGHVCFTCESCDFPVCFGGAHCENCDEEYFKRLRERQSAQEAGHE
jgi:hypothetical protein